MRIQRAEKGITLIALIITIIVLLILAGVSIAMLTGENGILKRAEGTEVTQAQAELTEEIQLAIMESLIDRDNAHTIDNVLQIAVANSYISINNQHTLLNVEPESSEIGISAYSLNTNVYVTDDCTTATVVDVDLGVWVRLGQEGTNVTIESGNGNDTINVADLRTLKLECEVGEAYTEDGKENLVDIKVKAILDPNSSKSSSYIKEIRDENGNELELKDLEGGQNGDQNSYAIYTVESNGKYKFTALEEHGGKATITASVSNSNYAEIEFEKSPDGVDGKKAAEVVVTINYDMYVDQSTLEYSTNGTNWEEAKNGQEVVVNENGTTVYARYSGIADSTKTVVIDYIDNGPPTAPEIKVTDISCTSLRVEITKESEDDSGIEKYEVIVSKDGVQVAKKEITGELLEIEFDGLEKGITYEVLVKAYDNAGYSAEAEKEEVILEHIIAERYIGTALFTENTDIYCECGAYILTVPKGYIIPDDNGIDLVTNRNSLSEGVVIQDGEGNEFVWVPTDDESEELAKLLAVTSDEDSYYTSVPSTHPTYICIEPAIVSYYDGGSLDTVGITEKFMRDEFLIMQESVETRGGFFVGRYEISVGNKKTAESKKGAIAAKEDDAATYLWYGLYAMARTYKNANNSEITAEMCHNSQYQIMIDWMTAEEISGCGKNASDTYTGIEETDKIRNIYDLRGGGYEYTTAANGEFNRTHYSGCYLDTNIYLDRMSVVQPRTCYGYFGARVTLRW